MTGETHNPALPLVSTEWLATNLAMPDLVCVDASWYLPADGRDPHAEFVEGHIPGAVFFDIDAISDRSSGLPHMLPDPVAFASAMRKLGIGDGQRIVVYDGAGLFSAPRVWWTFRTFGVRDVFVLDGGFPAWKAAGHAVEDGVPLRQPRHFTARLNHAAVLDADGVARVIDDASAQVVDARAAARFRGEAPEPRPGLRAGHIPGSYNLPWTDIVADGRLKSPDAVSKALADAGIDGGRPIVTTCGSGVSAAILTLALATLGKRTAGLYDGSWAEWGASDRPIGTGAK